MPLKGESQKSCATLLTATSIATQEISFLEDPKSQDCCYDLIAFVHPPLITDPQKNDKYHYLFRFDKDLVPSTALLKLQKHDGGWNDVVNLTDNTYGTFEVYGYFTSTVTNERYTGYLIDWIKVYNVHGLGHYRVSCTAEDIFTNQSILFGFSFCLKIYSAEQADGTVRIEWVHNGIVGNAEVDEKVIDYSELNLYQQFRINNGSKFSWTGATEEKESNWLQTGEMLDISRKQNQTLSLLIGRAPVEIHEILLFDAFMADTIQVTDYNNVNFIRGSKNFFKKQVKKNGGYSIEDTGQSLLASVEVELEAAINNHNKQLC